MEPQPPVVIGDTSFGPSPREREFFALDATPARCCGWPPRAERHGGRDGGDLLLLLNDDAESIIARANRKGFEPLKRYTVAGQRHLAQPAIAGNRVFIKDVTSVTLWTID